MNFLASLSEMFIVDICGTINRRGSGAAAFDLS